MRPLPPNKIFESDAPLVTPAEDMWQWVSDVFLNSSSPVFNDDHAHLNSAHIGFLWTTVENLRKGRRIVGQCECGSPQGSMGKWAKARAEQQIVGWFSMVPDFLITLDANYCYICSDAEFMALVEHELYHAAQSRDEFGNPKFNKSTGRPIFTIQGHDVEEFIGVVRRYGADAANVRALVEAANRPPEVSRASIGHMCGTCQLRVA